MRDNDTRDNIVTLSLTEKLLIARLRINEILDTQRRFPLQKNTNGQR